MTVMTFIMCFEVAASFCDRQENKHQTPPSCMVSRKPRAKPRNSAAHRCNIVVRRAHAGKKRPRKARSFVVEIKTASIFRGRNIAPSVFGIENKAAKRYRTSSITLSKNVEFSLSKQGVLCRLVKFVQGGCREILSKIQGKGDLGGSLSAPPAGGQWIKESMPAKLKSVPAKINSC